MEHSPEGAHEELRLAREEAEEASRGREEAEAASRDKSGLLASMSNVLRTPVNAVIGFSEMMMSEHLGPLGNERYRAFAADIHDSGMHLLRIINDIGDLARRAPPPSGRSELHAAQSLCEQIIESLVRLQYVSGERVDWRPVIVERRLQLEKMLTRSIEARLDLPERYRSALRLLRLFSERNALGLMGLVPAECPYSLEQILGSADEDWFPTPEEKVAQKVSKPMCSFCGKSRSQVKRLFAGPTVFICDECVDECHQIDHEDAEE